MLVYFLCIHSFIDHENMSEPKASDINTPLDIESLRAALAFLGASPATIEAEVPRILSLAHFQLSEQEPPPMLIEYEKEYCPFYNYGRKTSRGGKSLGYNADEVFGK